MVKNEIFCLRRRVARLPSRQVSPLLAHADVVGQCRRPEAKNVTKHVVEANVNALDVWGELQA